MSTVNINIRVDDQLKAAADSLFDDLGLNMTTAITVFLKAAVRCDGIPFEVKRENGGLQDLIVEKKLAEAEQAIEQGKTADADASLAALREALK